MAMIALTIPTLRLIRMISFRLPQAKPRLLLEIVLLIRIARQGLDYGRQLGVQVFSKEHACLS